jgi:hypothetical protein
MSLRRRANVGSHQEQGDAVPVLFIERLEGRGYVPDVVQVEVCKRYVARWPAEATREHRPTCRATSHIRRVGVGQLRELHTRPGGRGSGEGERSTSRDPQPMNPPRPPDDRPWPTEVERDRREARGEDVRKREREGASDSNSEG